MEEYNIFYGCLDKIETLCRENDLTSKLQARCKIKSKSYSRTFTAHIRSISSGMRWNAACSRPPLQAQIGRPPGPHERRTPASFLREAMMIPRIDCTAGGGPMPVSS